MINRCAETKIHSGHLFATYDKALSVRKSDISRILLQKFWLFQEQKPVGLDAKSDRK